MATSVVSREQFDGDARLAVVSKDGSCVRLWPVVVSCDVSFSVALAYSATRGRWFGFPPESIEYQYETDVASQSQNTGHSSQQQHRKLLRRQPSLDEGLSLGYRVLHDRFLRRAPGEFNFWRSRCTAVFYFIHTGDCSVHPTLSGNIMYRVLNILILNTHYISAH